MRLFIIILCLFPLSLFAQNTEKTPILKEIGFWPGFGYGNNQLSLPEGNYQPYYFLLHLALWPFSENNVLGQRFRFYAEPQYNKVVLKTDSSTSAEHEFGLNLGVKYIYPIFKKCDIFIYISTGPHAFSATTVRQAPGYVFSDNMGIGTYYHFSDKWAGVFTFRIRHLSNADTRSPNFGINTDNFHLGLSRMF